MLRTLATALALLAVAPAARATWIESGDVEIAISAPGTELVEASEVEPGDVMAYVEVGGPSTTGEVTVVGEGDINTPKQLGNWRIEQGTGNIQTVIGTLVGGATIGASAAPTATAGVLNILNSDLGDVSSFKVYQGTLNVAASRIGFVEVYEEGALYTSLGSRLGNLTTRADSYTSIVESIVSSTQRCSLRSTVIFEDSVFRCRHIEIATSGESVADVDVRAVGVPSVTLEATDLFEVQSGNVDIESAVVTTGELTVGSFETYVGIGASLWTNAGGTAVRPGGSGSAVRLVIGAGTDFHELADVRVAGHPGSQHLTVNGGGTGLEVDGDLRVGEYLDFRDRLQTFTGNMTVSNGAEVIVHGTLVVRPQGVLTIESGAAVYAAATAIEGTVNENGGTLVVPEPGAMLGALAAFAALAGCARRRRASLRCLACGATLIAALALAGAARADWSESGLVNIVANLSPVEAADIDPGDVVSSVTVGSEFESGVLTVVAEGDVTTRQSLGQWTVRNGQGNIQSTYGTGGPLSVATGNFATLTAPVLEVLNSDIVGNCAAGRQGTLRLIASVIDDLQVGDQGSAYLSMGSRVDLVTSESGTGKYLQLDESAIVGRSLQFCRLFDVTLLARDSLFACANVDLSNGTEAVFRPEQTTYAEIRVEQALRITASDVEVQGGIASTGRLEVTGFGFGPTSLRIAATSWVNEGTLELKRSDLGPAELVIGGGTRFLQKGLARIDSEGSDGLVVSGAGTELEVEDDLIVGQLPTLGDPLNVPATITIGDGADVIVRGAFVLGSEAVLNLNAGGTLYAAATEILGTVNENGGTLVVPEPAGAAAGAIAAFALAFEARGRRVR